MSRQPRGGAGAGGGGRPRRAGGAARGGAAGGGSGRGGARRGAGRGGAGGAERAGRGVGAERTGGFAARRGLGGDIVPGHRAVQELLVAGRRRVRDLWVCDTTEDAPFVAALVELAEQGRIPVRRVSPSRLAAEAHTEVPQGVVAHAEPLEEADVADLAAGTSATVPLLVVLDGVTDPRNLGAVLRTAEVAGATGVVVGRHRAAHVTPAAAKAAAGAVEHVPIAVVPGVPAALSLLSERGVWTVGLDADAERSIWDLDLGDQPVALVLGAEGAGLSRLARARCDVLVRIPRRGALDSLNVAAAAAVALFEVARHR